MAALKIEYAAMLLAVLAIFALACERMEMADSAEDSGIFTVSEEAPEAFAELAEEPSFCPEPYKALDEQEQSEAWQDIQAVMASDEPGDDDVIAIVGGNDGQVVKWGDLRVMAEVRAINCPGLSFNEAIDEVIVPRLDTAILHAEAIRLGHEPSYEEVQEYIQPFKEVCDGPQGGDCRELIKAQGYTAEEEYWKDAIQGYTQELAIMNLRRAYLDSIFPDGATDDQEWDALEKYELSLHDSAEIEWKDDKLKARYELALRKAKSGNVEDE